jgi:DNA-directed RNA polymerase specialized sigma24 family protein
MFEQPPTTPERYGDWPERTRNPLEDPVFVKSVSRIAARIAQVGQAQGADPEEVVGETLLALVRMRKRVLEQSPETLPSALARLAPALRDGGVLDDQQKAIVHGIARHKTIDAIQRATRCRPVGSPEDVELSRPREVRDDAMSDALCLKTEAERLMRLLRDALPESWGFQTRRLVATGLVQGDTHTVIADRARAADPSTSVTHQGLRVAVRRAKKRYPRLRPVLERRRPPQAPESRGGGHRPGPAA